MKKEDAIALVDVEYDRAAIRYNKMTTFHEGFALIMEELDELKAEVWKKPLEREVNKLRHEAVQVAAMALTFLTDLT